MAEFTTYKNALKVFGRNNFGVRAQIIQNKMVVWEFVKVRDNRLVSNIKKGKWLFESWENIKCI